MNRELTNGAIFLYDRRPPLLVLEKLKIKISLGPESRDRQQSRSFVMPAHPRSRTHGFSLPSETDDKSFLMRVAYEICRVGSDNKTSNGVKNNVVTSLRR